LPNVLPIVMELRQERSEASDTAQLTGDLVAGNEEAFRKFHADYFDRLFRYHLVVARGNEEIGPRSSSGNVHAGRSQTTAV
jgi:hypothetical protein